MAHEKSRRARGGLGYRRRDGPGGLPVLRLRATFLANVPEVCSDAYVDYQALVPLAAAAMRVYDRSRPSWRSHDLLSWYDLEHVAEERSEPELEDDLRVVPQDQAGPLLDLHDGLKKWGARYHLGATWVLAGAVEQLLFAAKFDSEPSLAPGTVAYSPPASTPPFIYKAPGYTGDDNRNDYWNQQMAAFEAVLSEHIEAVVERLEADDNVVRETLVDRRTLENVRDAARWQTLGQLMGEPRAVRRVLRRIGLDPRPGLGAGHTQPL